MSTLDARSIIQMLGLQPHPEEGGFYRETYRSAEKLAADALPGRYRADKSFSTAIYYLLTPQTCSSIRTAVRRR
jgi:predicted cupin superfamily sugar epimerase